MTTGLIMSTLIYVISMEFLLLRHKRPSWWNAPSHKEWGDRKRAWSQAGDKGAVGSFIYYFISNLILVAPHPEREFSSLFDILLLESKYHERYKTTKHETILHKLWWESGGKLQMKGVQGGWLEQLIYMKLSSSGLPYVKQGPSCSKPGFNSMKLSKL